MSGLKRNSETRPIPLLAAVLLLPLGCWDVTQAEHDILLRREVSVHSRLPAHPAAIQRTGRIVRLSTVIASRETERTDVTPEP